MPDPEQTLPLLLQRQAEIEDHKETVAALVLFLVLSLEREVRGILAQENPTRGNRLRQRVAVTISLIRQASNDTYGRIGDLFERRGGSITKAWADKTAGDFRRLYTASRRAPAYRIDSARRLIRTFPVLGFKMKEWWRSLSKRIVDDHIKEIRQGVFGGDDLEGLIKRSQKIFKTSKTHTETITKTAMQSILNQAKLVQEKKQGAQRLVWVSILDHKTSDICLALNGKQWTIAGDQLLPYKHATAFPGTTAHRNCRSHQVIVESQEDARKLLDIQSADDWLESLSHEELQNVLGVSKARLFADKKIRVADLINKAAKRLTVQEIALLSRR